MTAAGSRPPRRPRLRFELDLDVDPRFAGAVDRDLLARVLRKVLEQQGITGTVAVTVLVTGDEEIRDLNRQFRQKDAPTDVLSFPQLGGAVPFPTPSGAPRHLGDIVISYDRVRAQAQEYGHSERRELAYLAVHGMLHLLGFDHEVEAERQRMRAAEEAALTEVPRA
ncbi:MAG TPA: rRNA maturation RNase YbeY [Chloroflexota bacterium]|nr:rRNA maturation RNase YbeY [Chloroflexota bacterium]